MRRPYLGAENPNWKGGRVRGGHMGRYWMRFVPEHPSANTIGYVLEHRIVMEETLGRLLDRSEVVHHINGDPTDNRPENLDVTTQSEHASSHGAKRERGLDGRFLKGRTP